MRRLLSLSFVGLLIASVALPCRPGMGPEHHKTTRTNVTLINGERAQVEVHTEFNSINTSSTFGIIDERDQTVAGAFSGNKQAEDYSLDFRLRPKGRVLLRLSWGLKDFKEGRPTQLTVQIPTHVYKVTISASPRTSSTESKQLDHIKRVVAKALPPDFLATLRTAYAVSNVHSTEMPTLDMLYYVLEDLQEGLTASQALAMDETQAKAFKTKFWVDQAIDDDLNDGRRRPKDVPNP